MKAFLIYDEDDEIYVEKKKGRSWEIACFDSLYKAYDFIMEYMSEFTFVKQMANKRIKFRDPDDRENVVVLRIEEINIY